MRRWKLAGPICLLLAACGSLQVGRDFELSTFQAKAQRGVTSQADVRSWLGAPSGVGISVDVTGEQFEKWTYYHGEGDLPNVSNPHLKILEIKFDRQGLVRGYEWSGEQK